MRRPRSRYRGGNFDKVLVLVMDSLYAFPGLLFAGLIAVLLGKGVVNIALAITVIYIPLYFRVTRAQVLSVREELFVEAARALGAKRSHIIARYIAMNVVIAVPVIFSLSAADAILTAAGLSYLGLGLSGDIPDWGLDLSAGAARIDNGNGCFFASCGCFTVTGGLARFRVPHPHARRLGRYQQADFSGPARSPLLSVRGTRFSIVLSTAEAEGLLVVGIVGSTFPK